MALIPKSNITFGNTIQASDLTTIVDGLDGSSNDTNIIIGGPMTASNKFTISGSTTALDNFILSGGVTGLGKANLSGIVTADNDFILSGGVTAYDDFILSGGVTSYSGFVLSGATISGHVLPTSSSAYDFGAAGSYFRHAYLSGGVTANQLFVGGYKDYGASTGSLTGTVGMVVFNNIPKSAGGGDISTAGALYIDTNDGNALKIKE